MRVIAAAVLFALAGCATIEIKSKLYDVAGGRTVEGSFLWNGDTKGPTRITTNQEVCEGEYRSIIEGKTSVGVGSSVGPWGALFGTLYSGSSTERAQKGSAVAMCPSGLAFECEYITNVGFSGATGHGVCKDNKGASYRLMF